MRQGLVAILILNWKSAGETIECARSCQKLDYEKRDIVIIDNGSDDGSEARFRRELPGVTVLQTGANLGYAGGNNVGFDYALAQGADYVLVLNNDTRVDANMLGELVAAHEGHERAGLVSPVVFSGDEGDTVWYAGTIWHRHIQNFSRKADGQPLSEVNLHSTPYETLSAAGCGFLMGTDLVRTVGGFDEEFFLYWEEMDLSSRVLEAGYDILVAPNARMWHKIGETFRAAGGPGIAAAIYYKTRNRLLWARKHLRGWERRKFMLYTARSLVPRVSCSRPSRESGIRSAYWSFRECLKASVDSFRDPRLIAAFQGVTDYLRGRFGPRSSHGEPLPK